MVGLESEENIGKKIIQSIQTSRKPWILNLVMKRSQVLDGTWRSRVPDGTRRSSEQTCPAEGGNNTG